MHFVGLDPMTSLVDNAINIFLVSRNIVLYYAFFIKSLCVSKISLLSVGLKSTEKKIKRPFNLTFFILSVAKYFEMLPKHGVYLLFQSLLCFEFTDFCSISK